MAREQWAKIDVHMPTDEKLFGRPLLERHLWTCLVCLSKEKFLESGDYTIYNLDAAALNHRFNLGSAARVEKGLKYFEACKPRPMIKRKEGAIYLLNIEKRQAQSKDNPESALERKRRQREREREERERSTVTGGVTVSPRDTGRDGSRDPPRDGSVTGHADLDQDLEEDRRSDPRGDPAAQARAGKPWPPELLAEVRKACGKTDLDQDWQAFVGRTLRQSPEKRVAGAREFLEGGYLKRVNDPLSYCAAMIEREHRAACGTNGASNGNGKHDYGGRAIDDAAETERKLALERAKPRATRAQIEAAKAKLPPGLRARLKT
jgi:hypothetical protein